MLTLAEAKRKRQPFRQPGEKTAEKVAAAFLLVAAKEKGGESLFWDCHLYQAEGMGDAQI